MIRGKWTPPASAGNATRSGGPAPSSHQGQVRQSQAVGQYSGREPVSGTRGTDQAPCRSDFASPLSTLAAHLE